MKKEIKNIIIILVLSFLSFFIFGIGSQTTESDSGHYIDGANNLLENKEYSFVEGSPTRYREPGYSFFLSGIFSVFGKNNFLAVKITQFILFAVFIVFLYQVCFKYFKNKKIARATVFLLAVFPSFHYYFGVVLSESLYILFLGFATLLLMNVFFDNSKKIDKKIILLAIILGMSALVKVSTFLVIFLIFLFFVFIKRYKQAFIILILSFLITMPWMVRNYNHFGEFSITSGRQEGLYFASGYMIQNSSPNDFLKRSVLRIKKGFQLGLSEEEQKFVFDHNENHIAFGDNRYIWDNFLEANPELSEKDMKKYLFKSMAKNPLSAISQISSNMAATFGPEIPTVIKFNKFFEGKVLAKKVFYIFYLLLYLFIYFVNLLFLIKIFRFKKEYRLFYLFFIMSFIVVASYSVIMTCNRYNTPFFIFYILMLGFYFDYKYKEKTLEV